MCPGFFFMETPVQLRMVDDARHAWKWSSMRFIAAGATVQTVLLAFPAQLQGYLPDGVMKWASVFCLLCMILGAVGRVTTVEPKENPDV